MTNEYGLDHDYFERKLKRIMQDGLSSYTPAELARELARMVTTAYADVLKEPEFAQPFILEIEKLKDKLAMQEHASRLYLSRVDPTETAHKYFVFDPEGNQEEIYDSFEKAWAAKEKIADDYLEIASDEGWHENTSRVFWGQVIEEYTVFNTGEKMMWEGELTDKYSAKWVPALPELLHVLLKAATKKEENRSKTTIDKWHAYKTQKERPEPPAPPPARIYCGTCGYLQESGKHTGLFCRAAHWLNSLGKK